MAGQIRWHDVVWLKKFRNILDSEGSDAKRSE